MSQILTIEKVVHGGFGLARTDKGAVLVPGVLPEERVVVTELTKRRGMPVMKVRELLTPSTDRRKPVCSYFGECGGCDWLFMDYHRQLALKREIFLEAMQRIGRLIDVPHPDLFYSHEYGYRRRAQLKINKKKQVGFFRQGSNDVIPIQQCPLLTDRLNELLRTLHKSPEVLPDTVRELKTIDGDDLIASHPVLSGNTEFETIISCGDARFVVQGSHFFQGNRFLLERLGRWAAPWCSGKKLVDLYGGAGFFSIVFAPNVKKGWLIEVDKNMVQQASINLQKNGIGHISVFASNAESMEHYLPSETNCMIVDPPRPGLTRKAREAIARSAPETLIYVSCNCATQARDCGFFCNKAGYSMDAVALFDLYPNTHHSESIVILKKGVTAGTFSGLLTVSE